MNYILFQYNTKKNKKKLSGNPFIYLIKYHNCDNIFAYEC
jgi:hypothetical protein